MPTKNNNHEPTWTAKEALAVAREMWANMPGTGEVFFAGYETTWHQEFDKHHIGDLFGGMCLIAEDAHFKDNGDKIAKGIFYTFVDQHKELRLRNELSVSKWCCARTHIGHYYAIYDFACTMSHNKGECWLSENVTAKHSGLTRDSARRGINWLVKNGWLVVLVVPSQGKRGVYRPVKHAEWTAKYGWDDCVTTKKDKDAA